VDIIQAYTIPIDAAAHRSSMMSVLSLAYGLAALPLALATPQRYGTWGNGRGMADDFEITTTASSSSAAASDPVMSILPVNDAVVPSNNELPEEDAAVNDPATVVVPPSGNATAVSGGSPTVAAAAADDTVKAQFAASTTWDFAGLTTLPSGLAPADYPIADAVPTPRVFDPANVYIEDGSLVLKVQAYSGSGPISCGEIATTFNISYGSIRTWAVLTEVPGVVNGIFLYSNYEGIGVQETDIEFISDASAQSNTNAGTQNRALQYTNQDVSGEYNKGAVEYGESPDDATNAVHEYRLDWTETYSEFFLDGVSQAKIEENVPFEPSPWLWNNWANGDPGWTNTPPTEDALFSISKIEIYYNPA